MAKEMIYNEEELSETTTLLNTSLDIVEKDIGPSLISNFSYLQDLGFSSLSSLKNQVEQLSIFQKALIAKINGHNSELGELEQELTNYINQEAISGSREDTGYKGEVIDIDDINLDDVNKGQKINNEYLENVSPIFTSSQKMAILENINNNSDSDFTLLFTDPDKSNVLVCELKKILGDSDAVLSDVATDEEKNIQKVILNSMADGDNNYFAEFGTDSILQGMPYLKEFAQNKNITVGDLVLDNEYSNDFMLALKNIYNGDDKNLESLGESEIESIKSYVDKIAEQNNMTAQELLTVENAGLIKRGY